MDISDAEFLKPPRSESAPIGARPNLEGDHLDKDGKGQRGKEGRWGGKKRRVVRKDSSPEANVCYQ